MKNSTLLFQLVIGHKRDKKVNVDAFNFLINVCQNRLLYWFSSKYRKRFNKEANKFLEDVYELGNEKKKSLEKTLRLIEKISKESDLDYLLAKLDRTLPYISCDIDLLIRSKDIDIWLKDFQSMDYQVESHKTFLKEHAQHRVLKRSGFYKIDLTTRFDWQEKFYFDLDFLWLYSDKRNHRMNKEADFLVNFATVVFKRMSFNLLDYLYLKKLMDRNLDWQMIKKQVRKYHWLEAYKKSFLFLSSLDPKDNFFPQMFSFKICRTIFWEKIKNKEFSLNFFLYFLLARLRYRFFKRYLPFLVFWYPYEGLKRTKGEEIKL